MTRRACGFTLIEVLTVVVIMAILAGTIISQFDDSTDDAENSQVAFNRSILRTQLELYKVHHNNAYPPLLNDLEALTAKTDADGRINHATGKFGPYLDAIPVNPRTNSATVTASSTGLERTGGGWLYDVSTGGIWPDGAPDSD